MVGVGEAILIAGVVVLVFGASQIPKIARSVGEGLKEFKKAVREAREMDTDPGTDKPQGTQDKKSPS